MSQSQTQRATRPICSCTGHEPQRCYVRRRSYRIRSGLRVVTEVTEVVCSGCGRVIERRERFSGW